MATLLDAPEFTANEIYAIQQTIRLRERRQRRASPD